MNGYYVTKVRMDVNIEDEIQTSLNNRDRKIMKRDATIREQAEQLTLQAEQIQQKDEQLSLQAEQLSQKNEELSQRDKQLSQKEEQLRTSIMMLLSANFPAEVIAQNLNVSEEDVRKVESSR